MPPRRASRATPTSTTSWPAPPRTPATARSRRAARATTPAATTSPAPSPTAAGRPASTTPAPRWPASEARGCAAPHPFRAGPPWRARMPAPSAPAQSSAARPDSAEPAGSASQHATARADVHEELMATLKRRGYLQPSYEIYGGVAGFFDYGPLGAALKTNLENLWRRHYVLGEGMAEIQCPTISPEQVFRASGHLEKFADTVVDCPACGAGNRGDHLVRNEWKRIEEAAMQQFRKLGIDGQPLALVVSAVRDSADRNPSPQNLSGILRGTGDYAMDRSWTSGEYHVSLNHQGLRVAKAGKEILALHVSCPTCGQPLDAQKARIDAFNLMFKTTVGPGSGRVAYLRPETAQGMFMDFNWLYRFFREKLPFGAVQVGKAYRNEISPRQSLLRLREFHQMEAEVFFDPEAKSWPAFQRLAQKELNLLARDESEPRRMRMQEAVDKGIIANGALGYFIALTAEFLEAAGVGRDPKTLRFRQHGR